MIIGGRYRTNGKQLGEYLGDYLQAEKNDRVELVEIRGSASRGLTASIASWEDEARGSRCANPLWHAHLRTRDTEPLTREQQIEAVDILERHLGFQGQPRAIVIHENDGHEHVHVVWSRIRRHDETVEVRRRVGKKDPTKDVDDRPFKVSTRLARAGTAKDVSFTDIKNCAASKEIRDRFGLEHIDMPDFGKSGDRREDRENRKKAPDQKDYAKARRSKLDPIERGRTITALWEQTDSGKALRAALLDAGYVLARGDHRAFVVVDKSGDAHSLARQIKIKGVNTAQVTERLADIDLASIPRVKHVQLEMWRARKENNPEPQDLQVQNKTAGHAGKATKQSPARAKHRFGDADEMIDTDSLDPAAILKALTRQKSTFTKSELHRDIETRLKKREQPYDAKDVAKFAGLVGQHDDHIAMGRDANGRHRYTSRAMLKTELAMKTSAANLAAMVRHDVRQQIRDAAPSVSALGIEQRQAFEHVTSATALALVIGYAGTGKSFALGASREAWEAAGYRVRGVALAGIAARSLQKGSGIESRTLQSLFGQLDRIAEQEEKLDAMNAAIAAFPANTDKQRYARAVMKGNRDRFAARIDKIRLTARDVIVLDEAGMVGSRQMGKLLAAAEKAGAKVVMVGDAEQLQAIDAGGAFRALTDIHGAVKITEVRRQKAEWQKSATKDFGDGFAEEALRAYHGKGHIHQIGNGVDAGARMIADWTASRAANQADSHIVLAATNDDVLSLNLQARAVFQAEKRLGKDDEVKTVDGMKTMAAGDRFIFLQNRYLQQAGGDPRKVPKDVQVMNGSLGAVQSIQRHGNQEGHRITVKLDDGGEMVQFDTTEYEKFDHGYAATIHKSQGVTAGRALVLASQFMDRHAAHVSMTRHVEQADMYYSDAEFDSFEKLLRPLARDGRKDTTLDYIPQAQKRTARETVREHVASVRKLGSAVTKEEREKRAFERFAGAIRLHNNPEARKPESARPTAEPEADPKLLAILREHAGYRKHEPSYGSSL